MNPRIAFLAAPLCMVTYGVIRILDGLDGSRGPGLAWTTGHLVFLGAIVAFLFVFKYLRDLAGRSPLSTVTVVVAATGAIALFVQFVIDIVVGALAVDHEAMRMMSRDVHDNTLVALAVYDVGPYLFYLGQFVLMVQLAVMRRIPVWTMLLVLGDLVLPLVDKDLIPVSAVILLVSFTSIAKRIPVTAKAEPAFV
jgi:hypothetical protein